MPKFGLTSNPELDALLEDLRNEHFMPIRLSQPNYRLMYSKNKNIDLLANPITVKIGDESFTLTPKPQQPGVPRKKFSRALDLMQANSDFDVIPELLRGYNEMSEGQYQLGITLTERMARLLGRAGRTDILMQIARNADKLLFKFTTPTARIFVRGFHEKQKRALEERGVLAVLANTKDLLEIIGKREFCIDQQKRLNEDDVILGIVLAMFSDFSLKYRGGVDYEETTKDLTIKLKSAWVGPEAMELKSGDGIKLTKVKEYIYYAKNQVSAWELVLEGLLQAKKLLAGSELSHWLEETSVALAGDIARWNEYIETNAPLVWPKTEEQPNEERKAEFPLL